MKQLNLKFLLLLLTISLISLSSFSQKSEQLWTKTTKERAIKGNQFFRKSLPNKSSFYQLDVNQLKTKLQTASKKESNLKESNTIVTFPNADGTLESYRVEEASIMEPNFQAEHENMRTYVGQSIENPESIIYFSITPKGLHTMTLSSKNGAQFIDPYASDSDTYIVYNKKDLPELKGISKCFTPDDYTEMESKSGSSKSIINANDGKLRTFRLALASTVEYSTFHINAASMGGGSDPQKKQVVLEAMIVTMARVNGIFKRDLSLQMSLVNNDAIIFLVEDDGLTNDDASALINESQTIINGAIGATNYDIGHTFSTGGGGLAQLNSPCNNNLKARGITGQASPVGDAYDIDFVAHEMGHQFGAPHTWNGSTGNCTSGEWSSSNAYEPGSGSTIMAYAGICSPQNVQASGDSYFHQKSLQMIWDNITTGNSTCANTLIGPTDPIPNSGYSLTSGNNAPTAEAGASYTIPISTPYRLSGASTDTETTNTHTYTWEQYDLGSLGNRGAPSESNTSGPLVRSFEGTTNPIRYIPRLKDLRFSNGSTAWEKLASVNRSINFQLTVRDNDTKGGQTATDNMTVTTNASAGPFQVSSQNTYINYPKGSTQTITWDVANTNLSPINTTLVNIYLSTDGGLTFPTLLSNTNNDGMEDVTFPINITAPFCRIMVEAVDNIFFAINSENFSIGYTTTCNQQFSSASNLNLPILDNQQISNTINVPITGAVGAIKVNVDVNHSYISDLTVLLTHPNGSTSAVIWDENCFNDPGYADFDITFEDGASPVVCASPTNGTFNPTNQLSVFDELQSSGDWTLTISDGYSQDQGVFNDWSLEFCVTTITLNNHDTLEFTDLKVFPNPNKGSFSVTYNNVSENTLHIEVFDMSGRKIFKKDYSKTSHFNEVITLNNVQSGMYIMNISDGSKKSTRKIIVE